MGRRQQQERRKEERRGDSNSSDKQQERRGDSNSSDKQQLLLVLQAKQTEVQDEYDFAGRCIFNKTGYYILDLHSGKVSNLPRTLQHGAAPLCSMVALDSRIYIFGCQLYESGDQHSGGGVFHCSDPRLSYSLDLTNSQTPSSWKVASPPFSADQLQLGCVVAFYGKIYFFRDSRVSCLCQVYDPQQSQWSRIKSPPGTATGEGASAGDAGGEQGEKVHLLLTSPALTDYKNNRIIVCYKFNNISTMYAYYPSEDRWECLVEGFGRCFLVRDPVTVADGIMYAHYRDIHGFFTAFDLATKQWLNVRVSPDFLDTYESYLYLSTYALLHLPNSILCLLASVYEDHEPSQPQTTAVHVVQFKVELIKMDDTKEVLVTPLSSRYCHLDSRCHVFRYLRL